MKFCLLLSAMLMTPLLFAADGQGLPAAPTLGEVIKAGGWTMMVIVLLSVLAVLLVIYFLLTMRREVLCPREFLEAAERAAASGNIGAVAALCRDNDAAAAKIIGAAAAQMSGARGGDYMVIRDAIEDEGARQAGILWQRIQYLLDIAVVAPMVGLLGTVLGMLQSFSGLDAQVGVIPTALAQGVAKALITTAGGLIVGIAAMILYAVFRGRLNSLVADLETACARVLHGFVNRL